MPQAARWIRLGTAAPADLVAALTGLALAQSARSAPILAWCSIEHAVESRLVQADEEQYAYALIAPLVHAPGRTSRWCAWALAPAIATYRQLGVRVHSSGNELRLNGACIGRASSAALGECVVASASFLTRIPRAAFEERVIEAVFRQRIEAQFGWQFDNSWADAEERAAIEQAAPETALAR